MGRYVEHVFLQLVVAAAEIENLGKFLFGIDLGVFKGTVSRRRERSEPRLPIQLECEIDLDLVTGKAMLTSGCRDFTG